MGSRSIDVVVALFVPKILTVGYERELLRLRSLLLKQCLGVEVQEAFDLASALQAARDHEHLSLILLCHTVPMEDQQQIIAATRNGHAIPVLSLFTGAYVAMTAGRPVSNDPEQLLATIQQIVFPALGPVRAEAGD